VVLDHVDGGREPLVQDDAVEADRDLAGHAGAADPG
jgi:hypothetical protein